MRNYEIEFVATERAESWVILPDAYSFAPSGPAQWLQRLAWRFLRWAGALQQARDLKVTTTRHVVRPDEFMEALYEQQRGLFQMLGKHGQRLLIGSDDYSRMMGDPDIWKAGRFDFVGQVSTPREIMGLKIEVIPWMRGILVMP